MTTNNTMEEMNADNIPINIIHSYYRFAYDLGEKVLDIRKELNPYVSHNLPDPPHFLFTNEHASIINDFLYTDTTKLQRHIHKITNGVYNYETYLRCRDFFVGEWRNRAYTEKSFILACASIAYVAALFIQANVNCGSLDDAVEYIALWIEIILKRGTIDNSSW